MIIQKIRRYLSIAMLGCVSVTVPVMAVHASPEWDKGESADFFIRSHDPADFSQDSWETRDSNGDGNIDYVVLEDGSGLKIQEAYDYSRDGQLDDFYFYDEGDLIIREVDSDNDGQIDIWVRLVEGYLITEVQRDTTGDGAADYIRRYDDE